MTDTITVSTDGSALGNPNGPMGWAWADHAKHAGDGGAPGHAHDARGYDAGGATNGTNQIGELCAVLEALRAHPGPEPLVIESDSQYAINCATTWIKGWKKNGWKNSQKKPVKNAHVIKAIDAEISKRPGPVRFRWVKGHAGNAGNELVDELARTYASDCRSGARDGYLPIEGWRSLLASEYSKGTDVPPDVQLVLDGKADESSLRPDHSPAPSDAPSDGEVVDAPSDGGMDTPSEGGRSDESAVSDESGAVMDETAPSAIDRHGDDTRADRPMPGDTAETRTVPDSPTSPTAPTHETPAEPAVRLVTPRPTGLSVSGAVRFSPAPRTSPSFTGEPMHVHGYIAVDGFVDADGTLVLNGARFCI